MRKWFLFSGLLFLPLITFASANYLGGGLTSSGARGTGDLSNWLYNLATQIPALIRFIVIFAYISGFGFLMMAIIKFKRCAQGISMASTHEGVSGPLILLVVAAGLLYFAGFVEMGSQTIFGQDSLIAYQNSSLEGSMATFGNMIGSIILILRLVGYIAFIKGLYILSKLGGGQAQQGTLSKAIVHLVGGILAVNVEATYIILFNTLTGTNGIG